MCRALICRDFISVNIAINFSILQFILYLLYTVLFIACRIVMDSFKRLSVVPAVCLAMYALLSSGHTALLPAAVSGPVPSCMYGSPRTRSLYAAIDSLSSGLDARVGVAAVFDGGDTLVYDSRPELGAEYPLMSVMKFHQALAVCDSLRRAGIPLSRGLDVCPGQLHEDTWSPMRDGHPSGGRFSFAQLLEYTLVQSDNNACDILFDYLGEPAAVDAYLRSFGVGDCSIECTEDMMHKDLSLCYRNVSTPLSAVLLLEKFYLLRGSDPYYRFLWDTMTACGTGTMRIPRFISDKAAAIAHKTGTGDRDARGRIISINDIGVVVLPDGRHFSLAVFVSDAAVPDALCEELIAEIASLAYMYAVIVGH